VIRKVHAKRTKNTSKMAAQTEKKGKEQKSKKWENRKEIPSNDADAAVRSQGREAKKVRKKERK
jgi:hypothetical protein